MSLDNLWDDRRFDLAQHMRYMDVCWLVMALPPSCEQFIWDAYREVERG